MALPLISPASLTQHSAHYLIAVPVFGNNTLPPPIFLSLSASSAVGSYFSLTYISPPSKEVRCGCAPGSARHEVPYRYYGGRCRTGKSMGDRGVFLGGVGCTQSVWGPGGVFGRLRRGVGEKLGRLLLALLLLVGLWL